MRCIGVFTLLLSTLPLANAASIGVQRLDNGLALIAIDGEFELGDVDTFRAKVASLSTSKVTVSLRSEGGRLLTGIRIGSLIRERNFTTVVPDGATCASTCALAWLGGTRRILGQDAQVGFHAAYVLKSNVPTESGPGNAVLGAYLNQLGLSEKAILYITQAAPEYIQWMTPEDAAEHGITVAQLPPLHSNAGHSLASATEYRKDTPERRATDFVRSLVERSSGPSGEVLPFLKSVYAERVVYQGKSTPRQAVLSRKHRLADRWTERNYTIRPGSLSATCAKTGKTCRVKVVMSWKHYDAKTVTRSRGAAEFEYGVAFMGDTPQIVAETSSVHDRASAAPGPLKKMQKDFQQLLARVSKLVQ